MLEHFSRDHLRTCKFCTVVTCLQNDLFACQECASNIDRKVKCTRPCRPLDAPDIVRIRYFPLKLKTNKSIKPKLSKTGLVLFFGRFSGQLYLTGCA